MTIRKNLGLLLISIASVTCAGFGGGPSFSVALAKGRGFGPFPPPPPFPYPVPAAVPYPVPVPAPLPPQTHIIKVIHEHVNSPPPSKIIKVVHQHQAPTVHEHVKIIQEAPVPISFGNEISSFPIVSAPGHSIPFGPPLPLTDLPIESGFQILEAPHLHHGHHGHHHILQ